MLGPLGQAQTPIRVASYNIENYILSPIQNRPLKTKLDQAKVVESILAAKPDVLALQEVGTTKSLAKLQKDLKAKGLNLPYVEHLKSFDQAIQVAYLADIRSGKSRSTTTKFTCSTVSGCMSAGICRGANLGARL